MIGRCLSELSLPAGEVWRRDFLARRSAPLPDFGPGGAAAVAAAVRGRRGHRPGGCLVEVESAKHDASKRPVLAQALAKAKRGKLPIIVAKLDRDVHYISL